MGTLRLTATENAADSRVRKAGGIEQYGRKESKTTQLPSSQHGEVVKAICAVFLNRHCRTNHHPAGGLFRWDADGFIWIDAGEARDVGDICRRIVLTRWCPPRDDASDGVEAVLVIVRAGE